MPEGFSPFMHPQWDGAVEIRGIDGSVDAYGLGGRGDRMRRMRSGGRVVIRFG